MNAHHSPSSRAGKRQERQQRWEAISSLARQHGIEPSQNPSDQLAVCPSSRSADQIKCFLLSPPRSTHIGAPPAPFRPSLPQHGSLPFTSANAQAPHAMRQETARSERRGRGAGGGTGNITSTALPRPLCYNAREANPETQRDTSEPRQRMHQDHAAA